MIAQMEIVVRMEFEPFVEPIFCEDSYGYRPNKSAIDAVGVTRDGLYAFASAILVSQPCATQISDRFHLVKNLAGYETDVLQKLFQGRIGIPVTSEAQRIRMTMSSLLDWYQEDVEES